MKPIKLQKKTIIIILIAAIAAVVAAVGYVFIIDAVVVNTAKDKIVDVTDAADAINADCILVLGAGVRDNDTPSDMLRDRLDVGIELYFLGAAEKLLLTGDNSRKEYDEVTVMEKYCIAAGVPKEAIVCDYAGFSTYESLYRARDIFCAEKLIIVTQEYHLYRSIYVAEALGLEAVGVSSSLYTYRGQIYRDLREIAARNKDFLYTIFMPEPTYLGEQIPIK